MAERSRFHWHFFETANGLKLHENPAYRKVAEFAYDTACEGGLPFMDGQLVCTSFTKIVVEKFADAELGGYYVGAMLLGPTDDGSNVVERGGRVGKLAYGHEAVGFVDGATNSVVAVLDPIVSMPVGGQVNASKYSANDRWPLWLWLNTKIRWYHGFGLAGTADLPFCVFAQPSMYKIGRYTWAVRLSP